MLHRGHLYVGHMFSDGVTVLDARDPRALKPRPLLHDGAEHAHAPPAGRRRAHAARERREHRAHAVVRQHARLLREHARRLADESPAVPRRACRSSTSTRIPPSRARSRSSRCPASASTGSGGPAAATRTCRRTSTASRITSCASSISRTSRSRRSSRAGGCPACTAPAARRRRPRRASVTRCTT